MDFDALTVGAIALVFGVVFGLFLGRVGRMDDAAQAVTDRSPSATAMFAPHVGGMCSVRNFVFDGTDGVRREVPVHTHCEHVTFSTPQAVLRIAEQRLKKLAPDDVTHRLIIARDSRHEVEG